MILGGNQSLKDYFKNLNFPDNSPMDFKYKTKAGQYYRDRVHNNLFDLKGSISNKKLKAMVEDKPMPHAISIEEAFELIDYSNPNFISKPKEEKVYENLEFAQEKKKYFMRNEGFFLKQFF